ncbi:MAG: AAA family ATPase [Desulfobacteraceae bacterium]|nr:AAA family ATPase [Desulfobacteraceae bacterium]
MIIVCQQCETKFHLDDNRVSKNRFLVRCTECNAIFTAYKPVRVQEIRFIELDRARSTEPLPRIIAISNQKGGVAKTSTCLNLGMALSLMKKRVLLIDFDVQANLSISLGYRNQPSFYDAVNAFDTPMSSYITKTRYTGLYLLPSNKNMVLLNKKYFGAQNFEYILKDRLGSVVDEYDYILIDTPPSIEFFTLNALSAAGLAIIPSQCDYLSTHGVDQILRLIKLIRGKTNPGIKARILITMFDRANVASKVIYTKLRKMYQGRTFDTAIDLDCKVKEAQIMSVPVAHYDGQSTAGRQYSDLARELIETRSKAA